MKIVKLSQESKSRLESYQCYDCEQLPVIYSVYADLSFQELEYFQL